MLRKSLFKLINSDTLFVILILVTFAPLKIFSQVPEEENIKKFVALEIRAFLNRDAKLWESLWLHDDKTTRVLVIENDYYSRSGWDSFGPKMVSFLKAQSKPIQGTVVTDSFKIRNYKNIAWVEYNLTVSANGQAPDDKRSTREFRFLVKEKSGWKIVSQLSLNPEMFALTPRTIEDNINNLAFKLLDDKKTEEALDMFKVNIKLYPESWHAYDSIGEAYATVGKKDEAIQNYKRSIELNPENRVGKAALEKLQSP